MYIFSLWPVALLIHLDPFGVRFPFFGNAGFKISPSLDYNGAKWTSCCVAQKDPLPPPKLCNSFFLQKSWPGYSKISRSLAVSTDYFLSVELHCSNMFVQKDTCIYLRGVAHNHSRRWTFIWVTISGKRHCSSAVHMLGLLTKQCGKTRRTTSQKKVCELDFRTVPLSRFELYWKS